jgi:hypothetical protein
MHACYTVLLMLLEAQAAWQALGTITHHLHCCRMLACLQDTTPIRRYVACTGQRCHIRWPTQHSITFKFDEGCNPPTPLPACCLCGPLLTTATHHTTLTFPTACTTPHKLYKLQTH